MLTGKEKSSFAKLFKLVSTLGFLVVELLIGVLAFLAFIVFPVAAYPPGHTVAELLGFDRGLVIAIFGFGAFVGYFAHILMSSVLDAETWIARRGQADHDRTGD